jgi:hypothetical protein
MGRSGYTDDGPEDVEQLLAMGRWNGQLASAKRGRRGQKFFVELAAAMDAMPVKRLIKGDLIDEAGECCTMGVICKSRGIDVSDIDPFEAEQVGGALDIAHQLAADIAYHNDEWSPKDTPEQRWIRMRKWVAEHIKRRSEGEGVKDPLPSLRRRWL